MLLNQPYFMTNKDWYHFVPDEVGGIIGKYELTELGKSIPEVVQSHKEYYEELNRPSLNDTLFLYNSLLDCAKLVKKELQAEGKTEEEVDAGVKEFLNSRGIYKFPKDLHKY